MRTRKKRLPGMKNQTLNHLPPLTLMQVVADPSRTILSPAPQGDLTISSRSLIANPAMIWSVGQIVILLEVHVRSSLRKPQRPMRVRKKIGSDVLEGVFYYLACALFEFQTRKIRVAV
jgi:hypothetical protein